MEIRPNDADVIKKVNKDYVNNKTPESIEIEKKAVNVFEEANKMEQKLSDVNKIAPNDVNSLKNGLGELKKVSADVYSNLEGLINKAKSKGEEVLKKVDDALIKQSENKEVLNRDDSQNVKNME